jgi:hypothetical protein
LIDTNAFSLLGVAMCSPAVLGFLPISLFERSAIRTTKIKKVFMKYMVIFSMIIFAGCGDDSSESSDGCSLKGTLTGEVNKTIDWNDSNGCAAAVSGTLLTFTFGAFQSDSIIIGTFGEPDVQSMKFRFNSNRMSWRDEC